MKNMTVEFDNGQTCEVTSVAGGGFDAHLRNAEGETIATVHIAEHAPEMLRALVGAGA